MVYKGFGVAKDVLTRMSYLLQRDGFSKLSEAVGVDAQNRPRGEIGRRA